jgi:hypothetical protein
MLGELRQGALEGMMVEAVALAAKLPIDGIRRAFMVRALMMQGNLGTVAAEILTESRPRFGAFDDIGVAAASRRDQTVHDCSWWTRLRAAVITVSSDFLAKPRPSTPRPAASVRAR